MTERGHPTPSEAIRRRSTPIRTLVPYLGSLGAVAVALGLSLGLEGSVAAQSLALVFLPAVLASALVWGLPPSLLASVASVLAYNFFFLPPIYTFSVAEPENVVALCVFLVVAVIVSHLTAAVRRQVMVARSRERTAAALYAFSRKIAGIGALDDLLWATVYQIASMLRVRIVLLLPSDKDGRLQIVSGYPPEDRLDAHDLAAARRAWEEHRPAGRGADEAATGGRLFLPLRTESGPVGVIGIDREPPGALPGPEERRLLDALADQAAVAIERLSLAKRLETAKVAAEAERLRGALLTSISHDLRTPLASILGAASSLRRYPEKYGPVEHEELLATVQEEAERLNRFVANLLDMTRLESGAVAPQREPSDVAEIVGAALARGDGMLAHHRVEVTIAPDLPLLQLDAVLLEQVLFNLLDNAAKYTPEGSRIGIRAFRYGETVGIEIFDEGPGIPDHDIERIFDKFYRVEAQDRRRAGTGLGLAICRGFVEAMGGSIRAGNGRDRSGAVLTIRLPAGRQSVAPRQRAPMHG